VSIFCSWKKIEWGDFLESDLKEACKKSFSSLSALSRAEILIVGAGGFVGSWISAVLIYAKDQYRFDYGITLTYQNVAKISKILNLTELKNVKIRKGKHVKSLHEILTLKEDTEKRIFVNRDVNACKNILSIGLYYLKHRERPKEFIRKQTVV